MKRIASFSIFLVICVLVFAELCYAVPKIYFKFDDYPASYNTFKLATDIIKAKGAKADIATFTYWLEGSPSQTNLDIYRSLIDDPDFEIIFHSYGYGCCDFDGPPYEEQKDKFDRSIFIVLEKFDYLMRGYNDHSNGGDETTIQIFQELHPFFRTWVYPYASKWHGTIPPDANILPERWWPDISDFESGPGGQVVSTSTFVTEYFANTDKPYLAFRAHPGAWDAGSRERLAWICDFLNSQGCQYITSYEYYKELRGITDTTPPEVPTGIAFGRIDSQTISISWNPSVENESVVDAYKVYRDGNFIALTSTTYYTDAAGVVLPDNTIYQLGAINSANLSSARSAGVSLDEVTDTTPPTDIATVNDGTGADIDSTTSVGQLSANWTASADPDTGISGYKYAIGTVAGGTSTVGWTYTNATSVTKTGLSLTVGQTYYFSVKAINDVGLESGVTSSDGQWVLGGGTGNEPPDEDEIDVKAYPNPLVVSEGSQITFSVSGTTGGEVKIYTISGRVVKKLLIQSGSEVNWDVLNEEGNSITTGLYIYTITDSEGKVKTGKLAITQ
jgi:hypothetical protein